MTGRSCLLLALLCLACQAWASEFAPAKRIMGGLAAKEGAFPSAVVITIATADGRGSMRCGGSMIGRAWVLTAGHCATEPDDSGSGFHAIEAKRFTVTEGSVDLSHGPVRRLAAAEIAVNPGYAIVGGLPANDIALIRLAEPSRQGRQMLAGAADRGALERAGLMATAVGWGSTGAEAGGRSEISQRLMQVDVPLVARAACTEYWTARHQPAGLFGPFMLCAGHETGDKDACEGDSGGPLYVRDGVGNAVQVGVVSWGPPCLLGQREGYAAYTAVAYFADWIRSVAGDADFEGDGAPPAAPVQMADATPPQAANTATPPQAAMPTPPPRPAVGQAVKAAHRPAPDSPCADDSGSARATRPAAKPAPPPQDLNDYFRQAISVPASVPLSALGQVAIDVVEGNRPRIGDTVTLRVQSAVTGVLVVGVVNTDGLLYQLYPNKFSSGAVKPNAATLRAGETRLIGGSDDAFAFCATSPAGPAHAIAVVLPPSPGLAALLNQVVDLQPVSAPEAWLATLGAIAADARKATGLPTGIAIGTRGFDVVKDQGREP